VQSDAHGPTLTCHDSVGSLLLGGLCCKSRRHLVRSPKTGNNRIQSGGILNQYSPLVGDLERIFFAPGLKIVLQHGVIPGSSQTRAQGISSPGTYEASLMGPRNDGERQWNIMLDWTFR
jgi:hypothetical protein